MKKIQVNTRIEKKAWDMVRLAASRGNTSLTKVLEYCIYQKLGDQEKAINEKIAYHKRKFQMWKDILKEHKEKKADDGVGLKWQKG